MISNHRSGSSALLGTVVIWLLVLMVIIMTVVPKNTVVVVAAAAAAVTGTSLSSTFSLRASFPSIHHYDEEDENFSRIYYPPSLTNNQDHRMEQSLPSQPPSRLLLLNLDDDNNNNTESPMTIVCDPSNDDTFIPFAIRDDSCAMASCQREFHLYWPSSLCAHDDNNDTTTTRPQPLLMALHCLGCPPSAMYVWKDVAQTYDMPLVVPVGIHQSWNAQVCCGTAMKQQVDDVVFLQATIQILAKTFSLTIRTDLVYGVGWSNGGYMVSQAAASIIFQAIAPIAGNQVPWIVQQGDEQTHYNSNLSTAIFMHHSQNDQFVSFAGCCGQRAEDDSSSCCCGLEEAYDTCTSAQDIMNRWSHINECQEDGTTVPVDSNDTDVECRAYVNCTQPTQYCWHANKGHFNRPSFAQGFEESWRLSVGAFFAKHACQRSDATTITTNGKGTTIWQNGHCVCAGTDNDDDDDSNVTRNVYDCTGPDDGGANDGSGSTGTGDNATLSNTTTTIDTNNNKDQAMDSEMNGEGGNATASTGKGDTTTLSNTTTMDTNNATKTLDEISDPELVSERGISNTTTTMAFNTTTTTTTNTTTLSMEKDGDYASGNVTTTPLATTNGTEAHVTNTTTIENNNTTLDQVMDPEMIGEVGENTSGDNATTLSNTTMDTNNNTLSVESDGDVSTGTGDNETVWSTNTNDTNTHNNTLDESSDPEMVGDGEISNTTTLDTNNATLSVENDGDYAVRDGNDSGNVTTPLASNNALLPTGAGVQETGAGKDNTTTTNTTTSPTENQDTDMASVTTTPPTVIPTKVPTVIPTTVPFGAESPSPNKPLPKPSIVSVHFGNSPKTPRPSRSPTQSPTKSPTKRPTMIPTRVPFGTEPPSPNNKPPAPKPSIVSVHYGNSPKTPRPSRSPTKSPTKSPTSIQTSTKVVGEKGESHSGNGEKAGDAIGYETEHHDEDTIDDQDDEEPGHSGSTATMKEPMFDDSHDVYQEYENAESMMETSSMAIVLLVLLAICVLLGRQVHTWRLDSQRYNDGFRRVAVYNARDKHR